MSEIPLSLVAPNEEFSPLISEVTTKRGASFIVKRVIESDDTSSQINGNQLMRKSGVNLCTTSSSSSPPSSSSLPSSSTSGEEEDTTNSFVYPTFGSNVRKQSIRHSCRLHSHHHHPHYHHHHHRHSQENFSFIFKNDKLTWKNFNSPYFIWKERFMDSHECSDKDFVLTFMLSLIPNLLKLIVGIVYIVLGAAVFQEIDPSLADESFPDVLLFTFTTVTTIGYGSIAPTSKSGIIFCIIYICFGVPLVFLVLSNFSEMIAELYWTMIAAVKGQKELETDHPHQLPVFVAMLLILGHSVIGAFLFAWLMPDTMGLDYVDTFYFSFISITTIGFGDISPKADTLSEAVIIITYLSFGIITLSAFIGSLTILIRRIHHIGRSFEGAEYVEVYFGGSKFTVAELLEIVSAQFNVTPSKIKEVIQELDELINIAVEEPKDEMLSGPEDEMIKPTRENQQSISMSITSKQNFWKQKYAALEKDSEKMVHKKQKHIVILEARIAELERENGELKKSESRLQADVEAKRLICEKLDEDLKQVNAERNNLVAECKGLKIQLEEKDQFFLEVQKLYESLSIENESIVSDINQLRGELSNVRKEIAETSFDALKTLQDQVLSSSQHIVMLKQAFFKMIVDDDHAHDHSLLVMNLLDYDPKSKEILHEYIHHKYQGSLENFWEKFKSIQLAQQLSDFVDGEIAKNEMTPTH